MARKTVSGLSTEKQKLLDCPKCSTKMNMILYYGRTSRGNLKGRYKAYWQCPQCGYLQMKVKEDVKGTPNEE